jgi:hypothetical protein
MPKRQHDSKNNAKNISIETGERGVVSDTIVEAQN